MSEVDSRRRRRALARFRDAVLDLSDDPSPDNVVRYLAASRRLDESRALTPASTRDRSRPAARAG